MGKIKVSSGIEIPGVDSYANMDNALESIKKYVDEISEKTNISEIGKWTVVVYMSFNSAEHIGAFKRVRTYPSDFEKEMTILVPIPRLTQAKYGLPDANFFRAVDMNEKNWHLISPNFDDYKNLDEYIISASKRGIDEAFRVGITVDGKKLKRK